MCYVSIPDKGQNCKMKKKNFTWNLNKPLSCNTRTGEHFNRPGNSLSNMRVTISDEIYKYDVFYRKERESYYIRTLSSEG